MSESIFTRRPWSASRDEVSGMPRGMLRPGEGALLYFLARDYFSGYGEIIDAGAFLGASSYCLAKGLDDNVKIRTKSGRLHAYDLFELWREQGTTDAFMASELKRIFDLDIGAAESTLHLYAANLGALARHVRVYPGDIMQKAWCGRPIEILFLDICKEKPIWKHILATFYRSLIPGLSLVIHQDYHHPLLPFIHVAQERLADYFQIVEPKIDDSAVFLLSERLPDRLLDEVARYDFSPAQELALMDRAIDRLEGQNRHVKLAKCQLLRQHGRLSEARTALDELKQDIPNARDDSYFSAYIGFVETPLFRDEASVSEPPHGFDEARYLEANPDVKEAVARGALGSGLHHWFQFGHAEGRRWTKD